MKTPIKYDCTLEPWIFPTEEQAQRFCRERILPRRRKLSHLVGYLVLLGLYLALVHSIFGAETNAVSEAEQRLSDLSAQRQAIGVLISASELLTNLLIFMGACRLMIKPVFTVAHALAAATTSKADDAFLEKLERSKAAKAALFVLDWIASIKLTPPAPKK